MSMYTQLLDAAFGQHRPRMAEAEEPQALDEVHRCWRELEEGIPPDGDADTVPVVLARQIAYDVALRAGPGGGPRHRSEPLRAAPAGA